MSAVLMPVIIDHRSDQWKIGFGNRCFSYNDRQNVDYIPGHARGSQQKTYKITKKSDIRSD